MKKKTNPGGRPPLTPGEARVLLAFSLTRTQADKVRRVSGNQPSQWLRGVVDAIPEPVKAKR